MKKNVFLLLVVVSCYYSTNAQSISKFVVSSGGSNISNSNHQLLFTIGEPVIGTVENGIVIGQGFLAAVQADVTLDNNDVPLLTGIALFPNPVRDIMTINLGRTVKETLMHIYDVNGREVLSQILVQEKNAIDLQQFVTGVYIVKLMEVAQKESKFFKIIKD